MRLTRSRERSAPRPDPVPVVVAILVLVVVGFTAGAAAWAGATPRAGWAPLGSASIAAADLGPLPEQLAPAQPVAPLTVRASTPWVAATATVTGIGPVALRAYADATLTIAAEQPSCRVGWTTLAAIGATESGHGTHGGAVLGEDGRPSIPIIGPALDGRPGFAAIRADPEGTAWHGDLVWDHAVGPFQFLPSTWRRWGADGDGDRIADPNDLDDAALAAARYLCAAGGDLTTAVAWHAAVLSYNHSEDYAIAILASANGYAAASLARSGA